MARFEDVKADQLTAENKALYETVRAGRPKLVGPFSVLMHNPPLARAVNQVVDAIRRDGKLDKRLYELVVLITARHAGAAYAWAVHDPLGRKAGLSGDVVEAIQAKKKPNFAKADEKVDLRGRHRAAQHQQDRRRGLPGIGQAVRTGDEYRDRHLRRALLHDWRRHQRVRGADSERRKAVLKERAMFVKLGIDGSVSLEDRDNFRAFKLVIEGAPKRLEQARRALANTAELDDDTTAGSTSRRCGSGPRWQRCRLAAQLGAMIEKAKPHGWIDEQHKAIKAHIEWTEKA